MPEQPMNILFLMTDQHRQDHFGVIPGAKLQTPNLDRLAGSVAFRNAVTVDPVCTPARTALLTGKYCHQIGTLKMAGDLSRQHPNYMRALQHAGYYTAGIGKFHWLQGWQWPVPVGGGHDLVALKDEIAKFGLDYVWETSGKQLAYKNYCEHMAHMDRKGQRNAYREFVGRLHPGGQNIDHLGDADPEALVAPWPFETEDYVDILTADKIIECIRNRPADKPLCLFGSFCSPHPPYDPPQEYLDRVPPEEIDDFILDETPIPEETKKKLHALRRAYKAMILLVDDQVGRILDTLEQEGMLDNTVIFFTTDHGEMMGDHGEMQKQSFYRSSVNVPLAVRHPHYLHGVVSDAPAEIIDITATILEIAGLDPQEALSKEWPAFHDRVPCRSMMPFLRGEAEIIREDAFSECYGVWQMLMNEQWKFVHYLQEWTEDDRPRELLFNIQDDPQERINRIDDPACAEVVDRMRRRLQRRMDETPTAQLNWAPYTAHPDAFL